MSQEIRFAQDAANDLDAIWLFIAGDDPLAADKFITQLWSTFQRLAEYPRLGRDRAELRPGYRSIPEGSYVIYYRVIENGVEIMRVIHGARDIDETFH